MNRPRLTTRHLLGIDSLDRADIPLVFSLANRFRSRPAPDLLSNRTIVNLFVEDSTRTRNSFHLAATRLGASVLNVAGGGSSLSKGESLVDTVRVLESISIDGLVLRHSSPGAPELIARCCDVTVLNAGDGRRGHPTQALLDAFTLYRLWGEKLERFETKRIGIVGDIKHGRVAFSNIRLLRMLGAEVTLCGPPTLMPRGIEEMGVTVIRDFDDLLADADAVIMLRMQHERQTGAYVPTLAEYRRYWGLSIDRLRRVGRLDDLPVLHPGPVNRGVEIDPEVADSARSMILEQVSNGLHVRMALLALLFAEYHESDQLTLESDG